MQLSPERERGSFGVLHARPQPLIVSQLNSDHTQQQRSAYSAQLVTEDPGAAHLSIHLTLAPALPSAYIPTYYRARDKEELTYSAGAAEQREDQR